jgi:hypothetical protein
MAPKRKHCEFTSEGGASHYLLQVRGKSISVPGPVLELTPNGLQSIEDCTPQGSAVEAITHMFSKELLGLVKKAEAWVDEQSLTATLKISAQVYAHPLPFQPAERSKSNLCNRRQIRRWALAFLLIC